MKNKLTFSLLVFTLVFGFIACSDKDEDLTGDKAKDALIGRWVIQSSLYDNETEHYEHDCSTKKDYIEFKRDNVLVDVFHDEECVEYKSTGSYSVNGDKLTFSGEDFESDEPYTFKLNNNNLELNIDNGTIFLKKM